MRYLITGGSGYIGGRLTEVLGARQETEAIVNVDVKPAAMIGPKTSFTRGDVRDRGLIKDLLERHEIDVLIHLAFLLNPIRDEALMYDIDVNGTQAVLDAATVAGTGHVLAITSATAYGAWPENPKPILEDQAVRGTPDFSYARDKAEADRLCQLWAADHPDRVMTIVRPCIVLGPSVDNYISRTWDTAPFMPLLDGQDEEVEFVHEDDLAEGLILLLDAKAAGAFNVSGDGTMTWGETARMIDLKTREIKLKNAKRIFGTLWKLHAPRSEAPAGNLAFVRYPWLVSSDKLKALGWKPKHDSRETFEITMRAKGKLPA